MEKSKIVLFEELNNWGLGVYLKKAGNSYQALIKPPGERKLEVVGIFNEWKNAVDMLIEILKEGDDVIDDILIGEQFIDENEQAHYFLKMCEKVQEDK